jgi:large subunit ribosomal protein L19
LVSDDLSLALQTNKNKIMTDAINLFKEEYNEVRASRPDFKAGDTVNVQVKITEGGKERIQHFQGVVLQRKNPSTNGETFTVRKISNGVSVERIFPLISPSVVSIDVIRRGKVRRARIFYLRSKIGKAARIKELRKF